MEFLLYTLNSFPALKHSPSKRKGAANKKALAASERDPELPQKRLPKIPSESENTQEGE